MSGLVPVKLLINFANYNKGEVIGVHAERAKAMVDGKAAEYHKAKQAQQPTRPQAKQPVKDEQDTF